MEPPLFNRPHHQRIAQVLLSLDADLLRQNHCLFGGGTAIALRFGEFRESVDVDFLVSDLPGYRLLRQLMTGERGINTIVRVGAMPLVQTRELRADQYGIRTQVQVDGQPIKFEILLEGRIQFAPPTLADTVCGVAILTPLDMATSKLLANSDRWGDEGVFNRDVIDLGAMKLPLPLLRQAVVKAEQAYGPSIIRDLAKAVDRLQHRQGWLERCMAAMAIHQPKAVVWKQVRALRRVLPKTSAQAAA